MKIKDCRPFLSVLMKAYMECMLMGWPIEKERQLRKDLVALLNEFEMPNSLLSSVHDKDKQTAGIEGIYLGTDNEFAFDQVNGQLLYCQVNWLHYSYMQHTDMTDTVSENQQSRPLVRTQVLPAILTLEYDYNRSSPLQFRYRGIAL